MIGRACPKEWLAGLAFFLIFIFLAKIVSYSKTGRKTNSFLSNTTALWPTFFDYLLNLHTEQVGRIYHGSITVLPSYSKAEKPSEDINGRISTPPPPPQLKTKERWRFGLYWPKRSSFRKGEIKHVLLCKHYASLASCIKSCIVLFVLY